MNNKNIEEILKSIGNETVPAEAHKIAEEVLRDFSKTLTQTGQPKHYVLGDYIMKSRLTKLAVAAAVIIVVVLSGLPFLGKKGSGIALADVLQRVEQVQAFMYKMKTKTTGNVQPGMPSGPIEITGTVLVSNEYGMKMDMDMNMVVDGAGQKMRQIMYMLPQEKKAYMIMPEQKQYIQMEFSDDLLARMKKQSNDPRAFLRQIVNSKYTDIGKSVIDGVEVEGFETTDPACLGGMMEDVKVILWVDRKTELPVREEMHYKMSEQMQMEGELYDFQWYVQVNADEFNPVIPQDYTNPLPNYKMPTASEEGAIEGLRFCEQLTGRYPKKIDMMNLMMNLGKEIMAIKDSNNPTAAALKLKEAFKLKEDLKGEMDKLPEEEKTKKIMEMTMEIMRPVQSLGMFHMTLVQEKKEPAYYGDVVGPNDATAVLLRWKVSDNEYRVIFGDLRAETVTAEKLAELEAMPLNIKPNAIKPQPADRAAVGIFADVELSWMPGAYVNEHKVYFGTATDQMFLLAEVTDSCSVLAPALEKVRTYYWRVDEVQPDGSIATGDIWSFDTGKLVGWWKLDGDANDSSSNGNHGIVHGDPNSVIGRIDGALQFDGIDDYIQVDYTMDLPAWTVAVWVKTPNAPSSAVPSGPVHREKNFQINWNHSFADFRGAAALQVGNRWYAASFGELEANMWYHLAATYDGENLKAYKNGILITDNSEPSGAPDKEWAALKFARHSIYKDHFEGTIDDIIIYSYDLNADQVASIYASQAEEK